MSLDVFLTVMEYSNNFLDSITVNGILEVKSPIPNKDLNLFRET